MNKKTKEQFDGWPSGVLDYALDLEKLFMEWTSNHPTWLKWDYNIPLACVDTVIPYWWRHIFFILPEGALKTYVSKTDQAVLGFDPSEEIGMLSVFYLQKRVPIYDYHFYVPVRIGTEHVKIYIESDHTR